MVFLTRRPAPPLDTCVDIIWYFKSPPRPVALERVLPSGRAQLIVNLTEDRTRSYDDAGGCVVAPGAVVSGLGARYEIIDTDEQEHVVGVSFHAGGTVGFFATPAHEMVGPDVPLEALWAAPATALLREALLEARTPDAALDVMEKALMRAWRARAVHPAVAYALTAFERRPRFATVSAVADAVGMSPKRFLERFKAEVGVSPKQHCRLRRFRRAVALAHANVDVNWTDVALSCGYFDQAHFIHDFRAFSGLTPTGYRAGRTEFHNHVTFLQSSSG